MNEKYLVTLNELKEVHDLPSSWTKEDFVALLQKIEYDDIKNIPEEELMEMTVMALSDLEIREASKIIIEYRIGDRLTKGQKDNLVEELKEERIWEEYGDISLHEELFNISGMLYWIYPKKFSEPDIVRIVLNVEAMNAKSLINLQKPTASFLARILNDGMDDRNIIRRLFSKQLASNSFPESNDIIWSFESTGYSDSTKSNTITIYTSWNWVDELKGVKTWESSAYSDGQI